MSMSILGKWEDNMKGVTYWSARGQREMDSLNYPGTVRWQHWAQVLIGFTADYGINHFMRINCYHLIPCFQN